MGKPLFITSIGLNNYSETTYYLGGGEYRTCFASVAIKHLVDELADAQTILFSTHEAIERYKPQLTECIDPDFVEIPMASTPEDVRTIFKTIDEHVNEGIDVYIDITSAYRSLQFIYFVVAVYLSGFKHVHIKGLYYGAYEARVNDRSPVIDLTFLVDTIDWFYAAKLFERFGLSGLIGRKMSVIQNNCHKNQLPKKPQKLKPVGEKLLQSISLGLFNADAVFVGEQCASLKRQREEVMGEIDQFVPEAAALINAAFDTYIPFAINETNTLNQDEIEREMLLIDWYLEKKQLKNALTLIREWVVNRYLLFEKSENWLNYDKVRRPCENKLNSLRNWIRLNAADDCKALFGNLSHEGQEFAKISSQLFDLRNELSHGGYKTTHSVKYHDIEKSIKKITDLWNQIRTIDDVFLANLFKRKYKYETLIITPLGLSTGVLYTLLKKHHGDAAFVIITSKQARKSIELCFEKAGVVPVYFIEEVENPFADILAKKDLENKYLPLLLDSHKIIVNYTGGTSLLQLNVMRIEEMVGRYGIPVSRVVTIDHRSPQEQQSDPWVTGEIRCINDCQE